MYSFKLTTSVKSSSDVGILDTLGGIVQDNPSAQRIVPGPRPNLGGRFAEKHKAEGGVYCHGVDAHVVWEWHRDGCLSDHGLYFCDEKREEEGTE
jgi:hypothetical protein